MKKWVLGAAALMGLINNPSAQNVPLPQMDHNEVRIASLSNGIKTYIQKNTSHSGFTCLRVVLRKPSCDQILYAHDGYFDSLEPAENFFGYCRKKMRAEEGSSKEASYFCSSVLPLPEEASEEIAIVAVGDFSDEGMQELIHRHFSEIELKSRGESSEKVHIGQDKGMFKVAMHLHFPDFLEQGREEEGLGQLWKRYLIQDLFENRLERCTRFEEETWIHPHPRFLRPVSGYALVAEEASENLLSYLLWQKQAVVTGGFTEEEFYVAKRNLLMSLQHLSSRAHHPDAPFLAAYYVDQFLMRTDPSLSQEIFLKTCCAIVENMQLQDLNPYFPEFFDPEKERLHLVYPSSLQGEILTVEKLQALHDHLDCVSALYADYEEDEDEDWLDIKNTKSSPTTQLVSHNGPLEFQLAKNLPLQKVVNVNPAPEPFYRLPISDREMNLIESIILTMAEKNVFQLAFEKRNLEKKGKRVNGVHPLRFIGHIFAHPELTRAMRTIKKSSFKWDGFLGGFSKRMKLEYENNNLFPYVAGFSQYVHADPEVVAHYIEKRDWEGLVVSLM